MYDRICLPSIFPFLRICLDIVESMRSTVCLLEVVGFLPKVISSSPYQGSQVMPFAALSDEL